jgi:hypothetical protein
MDLLKGEKRGRNHGKPRALFLFPDQPPVSDADVCSGGFPSHLEGRHCPFSDEGRFPLFEERFSQAESEREPRLTPIERAPGCVIRDLGPLKAWQGGMQLQYPKSFEDWHLYKCRQMFLLVIPRISHLAPGGEHG